MTKGKEMDTGTCKECSQPLGEDGAHGLCPVCLMRLAMATRTLDSMPTAADATPPPSPEEMAGKFPQYEVVECLGRGGMGVVYKARQKSLDRWVAIKVLAPERVDDERFAEHFEREAKTLARMSHPNIVTVYDHGESDGVFYIVMEFIDGVNLRDLMRGGGMEPEQALAIVPPICEALEYAHDKGVVHRDIKPENLLLDCDGRIKIADFGIASLVGASDEKTGTPPYMAPEQEAGVVDRRADIYALGVVLYEMLTGERPEHDVVAPSQRVAVDVRIDEMVMRALEKQPELRYQTANEFRTVVQTISEPRLPGAGGQMADRKELVSTAPRHSAEFWKRLTQVSLLGMFIASVLGGVVVFLIKVVPRWEGGMQADLVEPEGAMRVLFGVSHFIQGAWPVIFLLLLLIFSASVTIRVMATRRYREAIRDGRETVVGERGSRLSMMALAAAVLVTLSILTAIGLI